MPGPDVKILGSIGPKSITGNAFDASPDGGTTKLPAVNFPEPVNPSDVATKNYVDTHTGAAPTGTGFAHVTSGAYDVAARAINLSGADVTAILALANGGTGVSSSGASGNFLRSNGTAWASAAIQAGDLPTITLTGDATGSAAGGSLSTVVAKVNGATIPAAGALVTGNGLYVSGASALSYSALNLAGGSGWVTGTLPLGNGGTGVTSSGASGNFLRSNGTVWASAAIGAGDLPAITLTGDVTGSAAGGSIATAIQQITGTGTDDFGGSNPKFAMTAYEITFANNAIDAVREIQTTTAAFTYFTYSPAADAAGKWRVDVFGTDNTGGHKTGDQYSAEFYFTAVRVNTAAPVLNPSSPVAQNVTSVTTSGGGSPTATVDVNGNNIRFGVSGVAAKTWNWRLYLTRLSGG